MARMSRPRRQQMVFDHCDRGEDGVERFDAPVEKDSL
jgi:hypothetical protein